MPGNDARLTCPLDFKQELRRERDTVELDEIASGASYSWDAFKNALEREPCHSAIVAFYRLVCPGSPDLFYKVNILKLIAFILTFHFSFKLTNYNLERNEAVHSNLPVDPNELVRQIETDLKSIQIADPDLAATFATTLTAIRDYITI